VKVGVGVVRLDGEKQFESDRSRRLLEGVSQINTAEP